MNYADAKRRAERASYTTGYAWVIYRSKVRGCFAIQPESGRGRVSSDLIVATARLGRLFLYAENKRNGCPACELEAIN